MAISNICAFFTTIPNICSTALLSVSFGLRFRSVIKFIQINELLSPLSNIIRGSFLFSSPITGEWRVYGFELFTTIDVIPVLLRWPSFSISFFCLLLFQDLSEICVWYFASHELYPIEVHLETMGSSQVKLK